MTFCTSSPRQFDTDLETLLQCVSMLLSDNQFLLNRKSDGETDVVKTKTNKKNMAKYLLESTGDKDRSKRVATKKWG